MLFVNHFQIVRNSFYSLFFLLSIPLLLSAQDFPLRAKYPSTKPISTKELASEYGKTITIVDVRSDVEFDVIHVKGAIHVTWGQAFFGKQLEDAVKGNKGAKIAVYCNGIMCAKSYHAAEEAQKLGFTNVYVYDAGVMEWAKQYPDKAAFFGKTPVDKSQIISQTDFQSKLLSKDEFTKKVADANATIIDIRDAAQRVKSPNFGKQVMQSPLDKFVKTLSDPSFKKNNEGKTLYFFDAVGKQVEWLQYFLKKAGYKNYFFLKDGASSIIGTQG